MRMAVQSEWAKRAARGGRPRGGRPRTAAVLHDDDGRDGWMSFVQQIPCAAHTPANGLSQPLIGCGGGGRDGPNGRGKLSLSICCSPVAGRLAGEGAAGGLGWGGGWGGGGGRIKSTML